MTKRSIDMTPEELERTRAQSKARRLANPEKANAATRKWRAAHKDEERARDREVARLRRLEEPEQVRAEAAAYRARNREILARRQREWNAANPEKVLDGNLRNAYGLSLAAYDAAHGAQGGACAVCRTPGPRRGRGRLCVDHDHGTGAVRALLCHGCNVAIGHLGDDPARCEAAALYLRKHGK